MGFYGILWDFSGILVGLFNVICHDVEEKGGNPLQALMAWNLRSSWDGRWQLATGNHGNPPRKSHGGSLALKFHHHSQAVNEEKHPDPAMSDGSNTVPLRSTKSAPENQVSLSILIVSYQPSGHL